ncbi:head protein [Salmonella enterica]|nr:head protein [Salmonella enterica subsp. enterica serovar Dahomey]EBA1655588.1 head protein [Salmonella enterica]
MAGRDIDAVVQQASAAFNLLFEEAAKTAKPDYLKVATVVPSVSASTGYGFLQEYPMMKEWLGARMLKQLENRDYSIKNRLYESSIQVKRTDFEDNDYGKYGPLFAEMGMQSALYPDEHIFGLLKDGDKTVCLDGQNFFDKEHPLSEGTTGCNLFTTSVGSGDSATLYTGPAWYLLDLSRVLKPLLWQERVKPAIESTVPRGQNVSSDVFLSDRILFGTRARGNAGFTLWQFGAMAKMPLNSDTLNQVYTAMTQFKTDSGRPMNVRPTMLVVPTALRNNARKLLDREYLENGESNPDYKLLDYLVTPWLD